MITPGFAEMAVQFDMSYQDLNAGLGWAIFAIGISCFITNGLSVKFGRRPVIIGGNLFLFVSSVWAYFAHSYKSLLASRVFGAIGMSPFEVLVTAIIGDIYFVHERGMRLAFWGLCLSIGVGGGSCISGYIIEASEIFQAWSRTDRCLGSWLELDLRDLCVLLRRIYHPHLLRKGDVIETHQGLY